MFQANPLFILVEGTLLFFLLVMAIEPKTSPILPKQQYIFGAVLGLLVVAGLKFGAVEPYAAALLVCNLGFNVYRNWNWLKIKFQKPQL
jgi:Na+-translocating ferredoxin:NAD+ oxidoreductase RnfD subunit